MALSYIVGTVTQGSADAFAQAEIATALAGNTGNAFQVREIVFELPRMAMVANSDFMVAVTRRSKTAMPVVTDRDVIAKVRRQAEMTTSGAWQSENVIRYSFTEDDELLIVEDPLYFQIDSSATTLTSTAWVRIGYTIARISAVDRLTLLTQSLE